MSNEQTTAGDDSHSAVSNEITVSEVQEEAQVDPGTGTGETGGGGGGGGNVGREGGPAGGGGGAIEQVEGYRPTAERMEAGLLSAPENILTAPNDNELRDIAEASFGPPPPIAETVHGPDDRAQINNTNVYPWRAHASLLITARDNSNWIGTGWFYAPNVLMTAGHVVFIKGSNVAGRDGWVRSIQIIPGRNGSSMPYGSVTSSSFRSVTGWTQNGDQMYDYGAIICPTNLGSTVGWFGYGVYSNATLNSSTGNISGYPGDKPRGTQWYDSHRISSVSSRKVHYDIDTFGGQSGSAVYRIVNGSRYSFAIHAYGGSVTNSGTRITSPVYDNMNNWKS